MKNYLVMLFVLAFSAAVVSAAETKTEATDMTLKGKLVKKEMTGEKATVSYILETTDCGKVELSGKDVKVDDGVKLDDLVGQEVEVAVKGIAKEGKKHVKVTEIVSAKKVEVAKTEAPAAVPAAPAAAPVAPVAPMAPAK
jgi:hypothetical protein